MTDSINPDHYKRLPAEAIEIIKAAIDKAPSNQDAYLHGQVLECVLQCWDKNGIEDLKKAKWYLDRLVDSLDEWEKQKAADLQSLKDHPFGKRKWVPKVEAPMATGEATGEVTGEVAGEVKHPLGCSDSWRPNDNVALAMQMAADSFGGKDGVFNAANFSNAMRQLAGVDCNLDGHVVATILGGRSDVEVLKGGSHYRYLFYESINSSKERVEPPKPTGEVTGEVTEEVKPPDGWRFLERGEVIRKGDMFFRRGLLYEIDSEKIGKSCYKHWMPVIRRNRFEVGEKVVEVLRNRIGVVKGDEATGKSILYHVEMQDTKGRVFFSPHQLAPYIEDAT